MTKEHKMDYREPASTPDESTSCSEVFELVDRLVRILSRNIAYKVGFEFQVQKIRQIQRVRHTGPSSALITSAETEADIELCLQSAFNSLLEIRREMKHLSFPHEKDSPPVELDL
jgi:hypothetical protein